MIRVIFESGEDIYLAKGESLPLTTPVSVAIPGMAYGTLIHRLHIETISGTPFLVRNPGVFMAKGFIVDQGPLQNGPVETYIFNLSNLNVRVSKGESISSLIVL